MGRFFCLKNRVKKRKRLDFEFKKCYNITITKKELVKMENQERKFQVAVVSEDLTLQYIDVTAKTREEAVEKCKSWVANLPNLEVLFVQKEYKE